jgi:cytochrome c-type biogenesis protein CcmF
MWRGDRLRSPGRIDSPLSREGAFLANNLLFGAFALIVLLGTVFPLIAQAVNGEQITVGAPYFNQMTLPVVICLLFLMAVAPVLPWRKASGELLRRRLLWPAVGGVTVLVACVAFGVTGFKPLVTFGLGGFAAASALRQLALATRRQGARGFIGRANGGMIVHLGVIVIAVAFAASHSFEHQTTLTLKQGETATFDGQTVQYLGMKTINSPTHSGVAARIRVNGGRVFAPAISDYPFDDEEVGTPSIDSGYWRDVYLSLAQAPAQTGGPVQVTVIVEPLVWWIWAGGGIIIIGSALAAFPGRSRRRPTDPVSATSMAPPGTAGDDDPVSLAVGAGSGQ